ncbi:cupin domain-containing protein [Sphingobacterium rhinopitheci]|uniref:cupin domain-containing protein n=1 Tax=Sphingobacterium rhinopitheci TaxID=2781960 RepID=UPI001F523D3D|nr:cupin domain-containing protein [Sphingobacterium rhinopitheci]MCI0922236.1 cupin domain-containing protein [Sphingobacterium rhinopitheci]
MTGLGSIKFGDVTIKILSNSDSLTVAELHFPVGAVAALHQHVNEENNYVVKGVFEATEGASKAIINLGDVIYVAPNVQHNLKCIGNEDGIILTSWTPSRKDLIEKISH